MVHTLDLTKKYDLVIHLVVDWLKANPNKEMDRKMAVACCKGIWKKQLLAVMQSAEIDAIAANPTTGKFTYPDGSSKCVINFSAVNFSFEPSEPSYYLGLAGYCNVLHGRSISWKYDPDLALQGKAEDRGSQYDIATAYQFVKPTKPAAKAVAAAPIVAESEVVMVPNPLELVEEEEPKKEEEPEIEVEEEPAVIYKPESWLAKAIDFIQACAKPGAHLNPKLTKFLAQVQCKLWEGFKQTSKQTSLADHGDQINVPTSRQFRSLIEAMELEGYRKPLKYFIDKYLVTYMRMRLTPDSEPEGDISVEDYNAIAEYVYEVFRLNLAKDCVDKVPYNVRVNINRDLNKVAAQVKTSSGPRNARRSPSQPIAAPAPDEEEEAQSEVLENLIIADGEATNCSQVEELSDNMQAQFNQWLQEQLGVVPIYPQAMWELLLYKAECVIQGKMCNMLLFGVASAGKTYIADKAAEMLAAVMNPIGPPTRNLDADDVQVLNMPSPNGVRQYLGALAKAILKANAGLEVVNKIDEFNLFQCLKALNSFFNGDGLNLQEFMPIEELGSPSGREYVGYALKLAHPELVTNIATMNNERTHLDDDKSGSVESRWFTYRFGIPDPLDYAKYLDTL